MFDRLRVHVDRARESLFLVPALYVVTAAAAAELLTQVDVALDAYGITLPWFLQSTAASARSLLSTAATATLTVAGVVFAVTLVSLQLAANQYSPRVIPAFLRDRLQQQVMGIVVGTFAYCLVALSRVRAPGEGGTAAVIPHVSSHLALLLAVVTVLGLVAFLDHAARLMQVGQIVDRVTAETQAHIAELYPDAANTAPRETIDERTLPTGPGLPVRATASGWVRHIDVDALLALTPPGGVFRLDVRNGSFVAQGQTIAIVWPVPAELDEIAREAPRALILGASRMMRQDVAFGVRQLVDIGLRALSPGINDPTTAYESIVHLGVIVRDLLWRDLNPVVRVSDGRTLLTPRDLSHEDYVNRAFDQIRLAGAAQSSIAAILMQVLGQIATDLERDNLHDRVAPVRRQGAMVLATFERSGPLEEDLARVRAVAREWGLTA